jgi:hypothetical protein
MGSIEAVTGAGCPISFAERAEAGLDEQADCYGLPNYPAGNRTSREIQGDDRTRP